MRLLLLACVPLALVSSAWADPPRLAPRPVAPVAKAAPPAPSGPMAQTSALCAAGIAAAEQRHATPPNLLTTIARVESGRPIPPGNQVGPWPWAIDADGQAYFFDTKAQAVAWTRAALAKGVKYIDVGCMQIDLPLHPNAFRSIEDAFDPGENTEYGARFLRTLYDTDSGHSWPVAVGYYHSHTPELAEEYRSRVAEVGSGILAGVAGSDSLYERALRQGTLHLALAGGGMLVLNLYRQPARVHRKMSPCQVERVLGDYMPSPPRNGDCRTAAR
jgi:hypothetical protein